ncbi:damage-inducible protein J [Limosilactobacillus mucosae]|uniref:Damage-inducible protein J n=1 Tax=Limosilactobacillus mucosae TaxID=97478 RepID=A0AAJ1HS09_LIMMU|nr:damage-inducible protein J [Limosilactobacillus mucosae]MDC2828422.1 damage-inducible protein J [Limosilactobacillus mucosae]MDC2828934.1 damage-inducible protein J [Limosilactobacillus mucosae]MDC2834320.1 damage-inducible protein J [Limosilactobacillus mucosae]
MIAKDKESIQLDPLLEKELKEELADVGMTVNDYLTMAAKQFIIQGKVPFEIKAAPKKSEKVEYVHFNEKTRKAIVRAYAEEEGLIPSTAKTFDNVDDAMKELFHEK